MSFTVDASSRKLLGKWLRRHRRGCGLTQVDAGKSLGYGSSQFISNWERGISTPPPVALKKILKLYGISRREMMAMLMRVQKEYWKRVFH